MLLLLDDTGAAPFTLVLGRGNNDAIPSAEAGLCRTCGPNIKAAKILRGIWPALTGYELRTRCLLSWE